MIKSVQLYGKKGGVYEKSLVKRAEKNLGYSKLTSFAELQEYSEDQDFDSNVSYQDATEPEPKRIFISENFYEEKNLEQKNNFANGYVPKNNIPSSKESLGVKEQVYDWSSPLDEEEKTCNINVSSLEQRIEDMSEPGQIDSQNGLSNLNEEPNLLYEEPFEPHPSLVWGSGCFNVDLKGINAEIRKKCLDYWQFVCTISPDDIYSEDLEEDYSNSILVQTFIEYFEPIKATLPKSWVIKTRKYFKYFTGSELMGTFQEIKKSTNLSIETKILVRLLGNVQYYFESLSPYPDTDNYNHLKTTALTILGEY